MPTEHEATKPTLHERLIAAGWREQNGVYTHPFLPKDPLTLPAAALAHPYIEAAIHVLRKAVELIHDWHDLCAPSSTGRKARKEAWKIYYSHSMRDMAPLRALLGPEGAGDAQSD